MMKLRKVPDDGGGSSRRRFFTEAGDCLAISGHTSRKGYRRKHLTRVQAVYILTPLTIKRQHFWFFLRRFLFKVLVSRSGPRDHHRLNIIGLSRLPNLIDMGYVPIRKPREEADKVLDGYLPFDEEVLRMLTPRRAGPVGPEEIGTGPDDKSANNASGSVTPGGSYEHGDNSKEFMSTGRTGRRNALPDILGRHAETGLSDLSDRFEELSTDTDHSNSGQDPSIPGTSKQHG